MRRTLPYDIIGVSSHIGEVISVDEWARRLPVPNRKLPGAWLTGEDITRITGIESKSWDPELFRDFGVVVEVARRALAEARILPSQVDVVLVVTATPYQVQLDSDGFQLLRALGIPDQLPPIQLGAGCCGLARAMAIAAQLSAQHVLVVSYEVSSLYMCSPVYRHNTTHPMKEALWLSPAIFSDGAGALVLRRDNASRGFSCYSRDSHQFGSEAGFEDPLIHYTGGGGLNPPGETGSEDLAVYAMAGDQTRRYYHQGMTFNHEDLQRYRPDYLSDVQRVYTHQSSPRLVEGLIEYLVHEVGAPRDLFPTHARQLGNLVTPSTIKMFDDDVKAERIVPGDEVCFSVVGAGPERGAFITSYTRP